MNIVLFGPPAAGKGTQAQFLVVTCGYVHLSTGNMLRAEVAAKTPLGIEIADIIAQGHLVTDDIAVSLIRKNMVVPGDYLLDGFPRTIAQAERLSELTTVDMVINFVAKPEELISRIALRFTQQSREDDNPEAFAERLVEYHAMTAPVLEHYRAMGTRVIDIDAMKDAYSVSAALSAVVPQCG